MAVTDTTPTAAVIGNTALVERLERDIRDRRLSHAYILDGRKGSGRHTVARRVCAAVACENRPGQGERVADTDQMGLFDLLDPIPRKTVDPNAPLPCLTCPACEKVLEGKCPDIHVIGREGKASIGLHSMKILQK